MECHLCQSSVHEKNKTCAGCELITCNICLSLYKMVINDIFTTTCYLCKDCSDKFEDSVEVMGFSATEIDNYKVTD